MKYTLHGARIAGVAIPVAALRTQNGWCVGEYADLPSLAPLCIATGLRLIQLLPVNDSGGESSPYSALSAYALHPLYLRVSDLPEAAAWPAALVALAEYAASSNMSPRFNFKDAYRVKMDCLRAVYDASVPSILKDPQIDAFVADHPWVKTYAVYKRLKKINGDRSWRDWKTYRNCTTAAITTLWNDPAMRTEHLYYVWLQLRCSQQFAAAAGELAKAGISLLGDIPILMNVDSADVWSGRQFFSMEMRAGAPPDMFSVYGQNWGFPIYNWDTLAAQDYSFWKQRIAEAAHYYSAYRIDHVLGFFRIWAMSEYESDGYSGRFVPGFAITGAELAASGFDAGRVRWLSLPHLRGNDLRAALDAAGKTMKDLTIGKAGTPGGIADKEAVAATWPMFEQIGTEDLYLFSNALRGSADIDELALPPSLADFLKNVWRNRVLQPVLSGQYVPTWRYADATAWSTLSEAEKASLERLFSKKEADNFLLWAKRGKEILSILLSASDMLACAEDLGAVPPCVPEVLSELGIPGLKIPRWTRYWDKAGQPFEPLSQYSKTSVCAVSVHDTSTLRGWWDYEEGREAFSAAYCPNLKAVPGKLDAKTEAVVLKALSSSASSIFVAQLQDYLDLSDYYRSADPREDRVNVPGTHSEQNWTWRMRPSVESLLADAGWLAAVSQITARS